MLRARAAGLFRDRAQGARGGEDPAQFRDLQEPLSVTPAAVEDAFIKANTSLTASGMAVECDRKRLTEVRICLGKDLQFRSCPDVARRSCRRDQLIMPPVRGG